MKLTQDELKASLLNVLTELKLDDNLLFNCVIVTHKNANCNRGRNWLQRRYGCNRLYKFQRIKKV